MKITKLRRRKKPRKRTRKAPKVKTKRNRRHQAKLENAKLTKKRPRMENPRKRRNKLLYLYRAALYLHFSIENIEQILVMKK